MRIALFCPSHGQVGGIEAKADRLLAAFRAQGHSVVVLARGDRSASVACADVPVLRLPYHQLPRRARHVARVARFTRELPGVLRDLRAAVAGSGSDVALALAVPSYAPYVIGLSATIPVVLSLESGGPGLTRHPRTMRRALRRAAHVVACARPLARAALALAPDIGTRLSVVPNGVDVEGLARGPSFPHRRGYVLAVARLSREKGVDLLLDAFARIEEGTDLLVAGDGPERPALERQRATLGLEGRVHFLGTVGADVVAALHRGALLLACPSRWEGLPLVCLEAMAAGRPVVAAAVDGIPDAVRDGDSGLLVPPENPLALAEAIATLLRDAARRGRLGEHGQARARAEFAWETVAQRHLDILTAAAAPARPIE